MAPGIAMRSPICVVSLSGVTDFGKRVDFFRLLGSLRKHDGDG